MKEPKTHLRIDQPNRKFACGVLDTWGDTRWAANREEVNCQNCIRMSEVVREVDAKSCGHCKCIKPAHEFNRKASGRLNSWCRECTSEKSRITRMFLRDMKEMNKKMKRERAMTYATE